MRRSFHLPLNLGAVLLATAVVLGTPLSASAQMMGSTTTDVTTKDTVSVKPSAAFPLFGEVRLDNALSLGTFAPGEARRTSVDLTFILRAGVRLGHGLTAGVVQPVIKNVVTYAESNASRPYDTLIADTLLTGAWAPGHSNAEGKWIPLVLPGGVRPALTLMAALPVSRASRFQTRLLALTPGVSFTKADILGGKLSVFYSFGFTKNFNRLTTTAVGAETLGVLARPLGPELVSGQTEISTGTLNVAFALRNTLAVTWMPTSRLSVGATYLLFNNFRYNDFAADEWTSVNAKSGRGRADVQWGIVSAAYTFDPAEAWTLSGTLLTAAPVWSADNETFRFPFYDFRSAADNYTSVSVTVSRTF